MAVAIVVGSKSDLTESRQISQKSLSEYASSRNQPFFEVSSKTGHNTQNVVNSIVYNLLAREKSGIVPYKIRTANKIILGETTKQGSSKNGGGIKTDTSSPNSGCRCQ